MAKHRRSSSIVTSDPSTVVVTDTPTVDAIPAVAADTPTVAVAPWRTADPVAMVDADGPFTVTFPAHVRAMADAFAAVAPTVDAAVVTPAGITAVAAALRGYIDGTAAVTDPSPTLSRGTFGANVSNTQSDVWVAAVLAGVNTDAGTRADRAVASAFVVAMWIAVIPSRRCAFDVHPQYGGSTNTAIRNARHPGNPTFANGRRAARAVESAGTAAFAPVA